MAPNTWYVLRLSVLPSGVGTVEVWRKDDPAQKWGYVAPMPDNVTYQFQHWVWSGTSWLDNYQEYNIVPPNQQPTTYQYDALDRLTRVTDAASATTVITYNLLGFKTQMLDPDMGVWTYRYDAAGNLISQIDAKRQAINFYYDQLNRLKGKVYVAGPVDPNTYNRPADPGYAGYTLKYYYDDMAGGNLGRGRRTSMVDLSGSTAWRYDSRGRVISETKTIAGQGLFTTRWTYDAQDRVTSLIYPTGTAGASGETVTYTYWWGNHVYSLSAGASPYVQSITYDAAARMDVVTLGNNILKLDYNYYPWTSQGGRLQQIKTGIPGDLTSLQDLRYTYDAVGNVLTIQDYKAGNPQTQTFSYDALDRLRTAGAAGGTGGTYATGTYTYSATGNILNMPGVGNYIYGPTLSGCALDVNGPKPHAVMTAGSHSFAYDCNGNMTTRTIAGTAYTLAYDPENHMTGVSGGGVSASFVYDGDGNRVLATVGGVTTVYLGNYWERDMTAGVPKRYYYAGGLRVGVRTGTSTLHYLFGDHLGSTSITANSSGGFVSEVRYMPFGQERYTSGATPTTYRFTGQRQDERAGRAGRAVFLQCALAGPADRQVDATRFHRARAGQPAITQSLLDGAQQSGEVHGPDGALPHLYRAGVGSRRGRRRWRRLRIRQPGCRQPSAGQEPRPGVDHRH